MKKSLKIAICAGGTGGHVFPAASLAEELKMRGHDVYFFTDPRGCVYIPENKFKVSVLPLSSPSRPGVVSKIKFLFSLLKSFILALKSLKTFQPDKMVGFGGYPTLPCLMASRLMRTPLYLHEQNAVLGRVNRLWGKVAEKIAISTSTIIKVPSKLRDKIVYTGMPVRPSILQVRKSSYQNANDDSFNLLVLGGSQGAKIFGELVPKAIALLPAQLQERLTVVQQCNMRFLPDVQAFYETTKAKVILKDFFENVPDLLKKSQLVLCRAGASTIAEIAIAGRPSILLPYSLAKDDHQTMNARWIEQHGGGWLFQETDLTAKKLSSLLEDVIKKKHMLLFAAERARNLGNPLALRALSDLVCPAV
jgi:UDP-N-acetylglucosamine--N-acetylmuramyl-(pentapeptide) pyrophosphoryl-undecaprenol N-acetylglucosamine transferase